MDHHHINPSARDHSNNSADHPPASNCDSNPSVLKGSRYDATLLNPGPPALYQLNTERKYIDGTDKKVRQWTYGRRDRNKQNKVILLVGETGAGKTTVINTMINYLLGVKFEDQEFYQITEEEKNKDQSVSQTSDITVYEAFVEENPTSLTIIDTPGYGDTEGYEKDRQVAEYLIKLFSDADGIHYIDAVCFVMKATQNRLCGKELYIFHSVLSLFGRDIENNIVFLLTQSDGGPPKDALNAIEKAEIPCRRDEENQPVHFLFNNRQKEKRYTQNGFGGLWKTAWEMGEYSLNKFFTLMDEKNRKSVAMTLNVLKERRRLEACVNNLRDRINDKELETDKLSQIQEALRQNDKIEEKITFNVKIPYREKVLIENEWWWNSYATCCSVCEENCHEWDCSWASNVSWCWVMENGHCTVCTGKCHYSKHVRENKKYVTKTKEVVMTFSELQKKYEDPGKNCGVSFDEQKYKNTKQKKNELEEKLKSVQAKIKTEKSDLLNEAYMTIMSLSKIALKADSALTLHHLDFLIPRLKEEGKEEWVKNLEDLRKTGEEQKNKGALQHLMGFFRRLL